MPPKRPAAERRKHHIRALRHFALVLILAFPVHAGYSLWRVISYQDRYEDVLAQASALWAHDNAQALERLATQGYRPVCPDGCLPIDQLRIRHCIENTQLVRHRRTWETARMYFVRCVQGEGYGLADCRAGEADCLLTGDPALWDPWEADPPLELLEPVPPGEKKGVAL